MEGIDWNDLRFFLAVARSGTLTGAAGQLGTGVATVARRVAALEESLGTRLFERGRRGYTLTTAGEAMRTRATAVAERVSDLQQELAGYDSTVAGTVRLTTIETVAHWLIIPRLPALQAAHPELNLEIEAGAARHSLTLREADIAVRLSRPDHGPYTVRRLGRIGFGLYAAPAYLAASPAVLDGPAGGVGHSVIGWNDRLQYVVMARALRNWCPGAVNAVVLDSVRAHQLAARAGLGLSVLPTVVGDGDPGLERIQRERFDWQEDLWAVIQNDLRHTARMRAVVASLLDWITTADACA